MKILIDNGHGSNTKGKRSPDGRLMEYAYTREIAELVVSELLKKGIDAERIVREEVDVPLQERCRRVNQYKANEAILVSIHCNAAGSGAVRRAVPGAGGSAGRAGGTQCGVRAIHPPRRALPGQPESGFGASGEPVRLAV